MHTTHAPPQRMELRLTEARPEAGSSPTSGHNPGERQPGVEDLSAYLDATIMHTCLLQFNAMFVDHVECHSMQVVDLPDTV